MHLCEQCAQIGKTCCQLAEILVTQGDIHRIGRATLMGLPGFPSSLLPVSSAGADSRASGWSRAGFPDGFVVRRIAVDPEYLDQPDDPLWLTAFAADGSRPILRRRENGDCIFLTPTGCTLDMETRPLVCRLFPFSYNEQGLTGLVSRCPHQLVGSSDRLLDALQMRWEDLVRWHRMIYSELRSATRMRPI